MPIGRLLNLAPGGSKVQPTAFGMQMTGESRACGPVSSNSGKPAPPRGPRWSPQPPSDGILIPLPVAPSPVSLRYFHLFQPEVNLWPTGCGCGETASAREGRTEHPKNFKLIRKPIKRLDTPVKLNGKAVFGLDVNLPGMFGSGSAPSDFRGESKER